MKDKLKFISTMLIFGTIGMFVKNINLSSIDIAFLRAVIGCFFLMCAGFFMKQKIAFHLIKKNIWLLLLSGTALGLNWILLFQSYKYTTIANATLSYYFAPMFVMILSPLVLKERLTLTKITCIITAILGLFLILNTNNTVSIMPYNHVIGIIYGISAAVLYASVMLMNKFIKDLSGFETTLVQLFIASLVLLPRVILNSSIQLSSLNMQSLAFILIVGVIHTGLAYLIYFTSMKEIKGQTIAILSYIDPITAVFISAVFMGESITYLQIIGGVLILGSTFISEKSENSAQISAKSI